ncbi:MAG: cytochrome c biogenesis protein CcsA [Planctomycetota bacterium]|nr:cytochrome c biogenesis protein CcsA [Planctomycetota bacterium]MDP7250736.1 cytochrome c biogenesis protein CcsA [Planctomycetota bacterium]
MKALNTIAALLCITISVNASDPTIKELDFSDIARVGVQDNGRVKPFGTYAMELVAKVTARTGFKAKAERLRNEWREAKAKGNTDLADSLKKQALDLEASLPGGNAMAVLLSWTFETKKWLDVPVIKVDHHPFKEDMGLRVKQSRFSYNKINSSDKFRNEYMETHRRQQASNNEKRTRMEREVLDVASRWQLLASIWGRNPVAENHAVPGGVSSPMIPNPRDKADRWIPWPYVAQHNPDASSVVSKWMAVGDAFRERDAAAFKKTTSELRKAQQSVWIALYPEEAASHIKKFDIEATYNKVKPFRIAMVFFGLGLVLLLFSTNFDTKELYWGSLVLLLGGVLIQTYGFVLRILITDRPPVSNMYESMIFMGYMATVFALGYELYYKYSRIFAIAAGSASLLLLVLADILPLDQGMDPLVAVLRTNYWLTIHVLTVMAAYSALTLAMGIGHINLGIYFFRPDKKALLGRMTVFLYRTVCLGFLLMTAGTVLGAWWAGEAWGRYWGWDPKETWSLICILGYGILLHGRVANYWGAFGTAIGSVIAWSLVGMCYYGVNFLLSAGLHSYGFGDGGIQYAIGYVVVEAIIIGAAVVKKMDEPTSPRQKNEPRESALDQETGEPA